MAHIDIAEIANKSNKAELQSLLITTLINSSNIPVVELAKIVSTLVTWTDEITAKHMLVELEKDSMISFRAYDAIYNKSKKRTSKITVSSNSQILLIEFLI